ncbi:MAG: MarR family winged helix-turn-helix transcriptional regulator [Acidimicrobiales bacterium]
MARRSAPAADLAEFEYALSSFVRDFGLNEPNRTPCETPIPVADAHTLTILAAGPRPQASLATELGVSASTVSRVVDRLVQAGWARRQPDAEDRRRLLLELTDAGRAAAGNLTTQRRARHGELLRRLNPAQRRQVIEGLRLLAAASKGDVSSSAVG